MCLTFVFKNDAAILDLSAISHCRNHGDPRAIWHHLHICCEYSPHAFPGRVFFNMSPEIFIQQQGSIGQCCHGNRSAARSFLPVVLCLSS